MGWSLLHLQVLNFDVVLFKPGFILLWGEPKDFHGYLWNAWVFPKMFQERDLWGCLHLQALTEMLLESLLFLHLIRDCWPWIFLSRAPLFHVWVYGRAWICSEQRWWLVWHSALRNILVCIVSFRLCCLTRTQSMKCWYMFLNILVEDGVYDDKLMLFAEL